jgi:AbrB family looped-hinge helix DNA binding protein
MMSTVTQRGQTAIPAAIRKRYNISAYTRLEWIDDGRSITVVPVLRDPIIELRGRYSGKGLSRALERSRQEERDREK